MNNKKIGILLIVLIAVIITVVILDFSSSKIENLPINIYELKTDDFKHVDENLIHYKETKQIITGKENPKGIAYKNEVIYLLTENSIKFLDVNGYLLNKIDLSSEPNCINVTDSSIIIGFRDYFEILDFNGTSLIKTSKIYDKSVYTSIASLDSLIFVADAGSRKVLIFDKLGKLKTEFNGSSESDSKNEFIVPSPYFDLAINNFNELWVANPGLHAFQQYSTDGRLLGFWEKSSLNIDGFVGCCNPAQFTFLPNGNFITSEKKIVRIKIYKPSGELESVVAAPNKFMDEGHAPEVTCDENGIIIALDFDKKLIRFFEKK